MQVKTASPQRSDDGQTNKKITGDAETKLHRLCDFMT